MYEFCRFFRIYLLLKRLVRINIKIPEEVPINNNNKIKFTEKELVSTRHSRWDAHADHSYRASPRVCLV